MLFWIIENLELWFFILFKCLIIFVLLFLYCIKNCVFFYGVNRLIVLNVWVFNVY